ncbi:hypothetical protein VHEMI05292 [[Torrubiella] hemipterigena]|uniref:Uncharacterized protein n=1 Tax=[Torrubiella] hemipterigena TaxID=1531966 RepID=A0A0A1T3N4_9HYPO|nr:hypothetical protein VHEMI05292 [[Torrubiella] hemipterigena]
MPDAAAEPYDGLYDLLNLVKTEPTPPVPQKGTITKQIEIIDLTGPDEDMPSTNGRTKENISRIDTDGFKDIQFNSSEGIASIGVKRAKHWARQKDRWRLTIASLWEMLHMRRQRIFELMHNPVKEAWRLTVDICLRMARKGSKDHSEESIKLANDVCYLYLAFLTCQVRNQKQGDGLKKKALDRLNRNHSKLFGKFCRFIYAVEPHFPQQDQIANMVSIEDAQQSEGMMEEDGSRKSSGHSKQPKEIIQDRRAMNMRKADQEREKWNTERAQAFWDKVDIKDIDRARFIINDTKGDDQGLIFVEKRICTLIKDHQMKGVRFLWNQIVVGAGAGERQGCLLAHTMGLGKTMQTIAFLVALVEAGASSDPTIREQVPPDLRESKTLVLCPTSLVHNWEEEVRRWGHGLLGKIRKIEASDDGRVAILMDWSQHGGILIIGYDMAKRLYDGGDDDTKRTLLESANVVVADEAHHLKNQESQISQLCSKFATGSRIALTGSPLANNIDEYYSMIDWLAPNYLGPLQEFKQMYAKPIQDGVWGDSTDVEKRHALTLLEALQKTVGPKVNRATIHGSLKDELPPKVEFVLSVRATPLQKSLYTLFVEGLDKMYRASNRRQTGILSLLSRLVLICNHPCVFRSYVASIGDDEDDAKTFPKDIIDQVLQLTADSNGDDIKHSNKLRVLMNILDESRRVGDKVLVFSQSIPTLDYLQWVLELENRPFCRLDGRTNVKIRQSTVKSFNEGPQEVFLISTTAGGYGLNIQGANRVVIFDFKFNPVHDQQAVGRAYRIGQKKPVFVYHFVTSGSFEEDLHAKSVFKMQLSARVVDKANPISWSEQRKKWLHDIAEPGPKDLSPFQGKDGVLDAILSTLGNREITSIISTDVFEEEDLTSGLTAEEQQMAQSLSEAIMSLRKDPKSTHNLANVSNRQDAKVANQSNLYEKAADGFLALKLKADNTATSPAVNEAAPITKPGSAKLTAKPSQHKEVFINRLESSVVLVTSETHSNVKKIVSEIATALKDKRGGFLYDDARWKFLAEMAEKAQFPKAVLVGKISPAQLATTEESEIRNMLEA